jgi:glycosyltransferase involved in cell wall biosynthesis
LIKEKLANKITAYIIVYNDVDKIEAAINSVLWADEVLVIDSHSTDGTTELAHKTLLIAASILSTSL